MASAPEPHNPKQGSTKQWIRFVLPMVLISLLSADPSHHDHHHHQQQHTTQTSNNDKCPDHSLHEAHTKLSESVRLGKPLQNYDAGGLPFYKHTLPPVGDHYDVCIIGAGLTGSVLAERYANVLNRTVLIMDVRTHIGGNCYDFREPLSGIRLNLYGAHLFHTNIERVYRYVTQWRGNEEEEEGGGGGEEGGVLWERYDHQVVGWLRGKLLPIPVNINTVNGLFGTSIANPAEMDEWLQSVQIPCPPSKQNNHDETEETHTCRNAEEMAKSRVGNDLFDLIFRTYTSKQWNKEPKHLDASVTARIPVRNNFDNRYFSDRYQMLPKHGYTSWFAHLLQSTDIDIVLGVDYFTVQNELRARCGKTFFTGPIDRYFHNANLEPLEYRSIHFQSDLTPNTGYYQTHSVVNYPGPEVNYTRIVEYKHYLRQTSDYTITVKEFSTDDGDPYYPVPNPKNHGLYERYKELALEEEKRNNVYFVGRLASYKYFNMDKAIENALDTFDRLEGYPEQPVIDGDGEKDGNGGGGGGEE